MLRTFSLAVPFAAVLLALGCGPPKETIPPGACTGRLPGDLVISEFLADPEGADEGKEFIEIFNASSQVITLTGTVLIHSRPDGSAEKKATLKQGTIAPGDYYVVGDVREGDLPGHLNDTYADALGALSNTSGIIGVSCGTTVLDVTTYTITKEKASRIFDGNIAPDAQANDDETRWCNATTQTGDFFGSPRNRNAPCLKTVCSGRFPGDLVITEFMPNPAGEDTGNEYIEIFNAGFSTVDLEGITLKYSRADGTAPKEVILAGGTVPIGKYVTIGDVRTTTLPAHIDFSYGATLGALGNTDGILTVACGPTTLDEITYTRMKEGAARVFDGNLQPNATANDDEGSWCDAKAPFGTSFGSPRGTNEACGSVATGCIDSVSGLSRPLVPPLPGKLLVTEVMANPLGIDSEKEWFELLALEPMDLNGVVVSRDTQTGTSRVTITSEQCIALGTQSYAVLARKIAPDVNGGIASPVATFNFSLTDGASLFVTYTGTLIDSATYPASTSASAGTSTELSSDRLDPAVNDSEYAWCDGQTTYGAGGKGTPGLVNRLCVAPVGPGECRDLSTTADGGFARGILRPDAGSVAFTEVMPAPHVPTGVATDRPKEWFELTALVTVDLNEAELLNELGSKITIKQAACFTIQPGEYVLFGQTINAATNGGLPKPRVIFDFDLNNTASTANPERAVSIRSQGAELDRFSWTASTVGASIQLTSAVTPSPTENDIAANRCDAPATVPYGDAGTPDLGTPGAANVACP